jgi:hypothetical protein
MMRDFDMSNDPYQSHDDTKLDADFDAHEAYLESHENDPLDASLSVKIQRLTLERLQMYCKQYKQDINEVINDALNDLLDLEGM